MRIAIGEFKHEVNTFSPVLTTLDTFKTYQLLEGEDILRVLRQTNTELWGFWQEAVVQNWEVVPLVAANALSGGPLTAETYLYLKDQFLRRLQEVGRVDALFLALHGATVANVPGGEDATGLFLRELRHIVGDQMPVIVTLDLHANVTSQIVQHATTVIGYRTWPHVDLAERGQEAAQFLARIFTNQIKPTTALAKLPMILQVENGQTTSGPMATLLTELRNWENAGQCLGGSIYLVQPWMDLPAVGCAVTIITHNDPAHAQNLADELALQMWQIRRDFEIKLVPLNEAIEQAAKAAGKPVVLADSADSTGSGAPGDSTSILQQLLTQQIACKVLLPIVDKPAVQAAAEAGVGASLSLTLGGRIDPVYSRPVSLEVEVEWVGEARFRFKGPVFTGQEANMGRVAVLRIWDIHILVSERPAWTVDPEMYRCVDLEPAEAQIVVVKSPNQFRAGYEALAHEIIVVDAPGCASANLRTLPFQRLPRPFYPFDEEWPGAPWP